MSQRAGYLRLRVGRGLDKPKDFRDTADAPLEAQLNDVVVWLLSHSITLVERERPAEAARIAEAERARVARAAEILRYEESERRRKAKARADQLVVDAEQWRKAENLRAYVRAADAALGIDDEWKTWALGVADDLDPRVDGEDGRR